MSKLVSGVFRDLDGVVHRVIGARIQDLLAVASETWVSWQIHALCTKPRLAVDGDPTTANLGVTCMTCIARTTD